MTGYYKKRILQELNNIFKEIKDNYKLFKELNNNKEEILASGEWLLDNIYLIEKEFKNIKHNMPKEYYNDLPSFEKLEIDNVPRILIYAKEYIKIRHCVVKEKDVIKFIKEKEDKFTIGELWAFPLMLRISILGMISKITNKMVDLQKDLAKEDSEDKDNFLEVSIEQTISACINSLREIEGINWRNFFEETSFAEKLLKLDPADVYRYMDFKTKDYYRHRIEELSRQFQVEEITLIEKILYMARRSKEWGKRRCRSHIGYYLIDDGVEELAERFKIQTKIKNRYSSGLYIFINIFATLGIIGLVMGISYLLGFSFTLGEYIILAILMVIPTSEIVVSIINLEVSRHIRMRYVPKLDFSKGLPKEDKTIVVIPAIIPSKERAKELMEHLEVAYLGNADPNVYYALLGDFKDSKYKNLSDDKEILDEAMKETRRLNAKYFKGEKHFFFLNREKELNLREGYYIGWERKRGKIMEFISLIKGDENTSFKEISSDISILKRAKYLITLDADTFMPRDTVKQLVGAMAHILNIPVVGEDKRIKHGYSIMQPKVSISLESKNKSTFSRIFGGDSGVDGYSTAYSDTYQDLFAEGTFVGKGIIDINAFYDVLNDEIPEDKVLSHDLLEGSYTRCALVTDIEFIDNYPFSYEGSCKRVHRWTRGDWQLIRWLFSKRLSLLSRWKILDNLRRSLLAPNLLLAVILNLTIYKGNGQIAMLCLLAAMMPLVFTVTDFVVTPRNKLMGTFKSFYEIILIISFIPYQAYLMMDAIFRTIFRLTISKKHLLQWQTAEEAERTTNNSLRAYTKRMWFAQASGIIVMLLAFGESPLVQIINLMLGILWVFSPYIAFYISLVYREERYKFKEDEEVFLRDNARRIWAYYEDFVNEENNYLAPDNYQEEPYKGVAYRTSPTNIGMGLTSNLVAYDLGYISFGGVIDRLELILNGMNKLQKFNGHYINWYDTRTCSPLWPRYISTVDSGNLLGYLWVITEALGEYKHNPLIREEEIKALKDTALLCNIKIEDKAISIEGYGDILQELLTKLEKEEDSYWLQKLKKEIKLKLAYYEFFFSDIKDELKEEKKIPSIYELIYLLKEKENNEDSPKVKEKINVLKTFLERVDNIVIELDNIMKEMDFSFLYKKERGLFSIGYNLEEKSLGNSYYDLLASESRATSFIAIALNQVPKEHWFKLSRAMTDTYKGKSLVSWSGTMFEYFMPPLIMKNYKETLLDETYKSVINAQKEFAKEKKVPFGISESAYYHFDMAENYQYKAFGVPGIGLKRGLEDELVISPYSSLITLPFDTEAAINNLKVIKNEDTYGRYGFIEAIDYTPSRVSKMDFGYDGVQSKNVRCYMVHHLGMSLMALDNTLNNNILVERFHRIPQVKATELILKESIPDIITFEHDEDFSVVRNTLEKEVFEPRIFEGAKRENPETLILSNGSYSLMTTLSGSGYARKGEMTIYRWKGDSTTDSTGSFIYIKNLNSNDYWSSTFEPCKDEGEKYLVELALDKATYKRSDGSIESTMEVVVSPEDDVEIRKVILKNTGEKGRTIELTSYMEVTLQSFEGDAVHPSFSNLFISTEYVEEEKCLLGNRRPRVKNGAVPYIMHKLLTESQLEGSITYETSRVNFIGRNRDLKNPKALDSDAVLLNTVGTVLDPIMSMRVKVRLEANEEKIVYFITSVASSRKEALELAKKYGEVSKAEYSFDAYNRAIQLELKAIGIKPNAANIYQTLASYILFLHSGRKDREEYIKNINKNQQDLWAYGISGDLPIAMVLVNGEEDMEIIRSMIKMHYYLKAKGLKSDLLIYNDEEVSYEQPLQQSIISAINLSKEGDAINKPGGIFIHNKTTMGEDIVKLLIGISAIYVDSSKGSILTQLNESETLIEGEVLRHKELMDNLRIMPEINKEKVKEEDSIFNEEYEESIPKVTEFDTSKLDFFNGYGGFDPTDKSYVIKLNQYKNTPAPWINVISNEDFGFHVSEVGSSYTWCGNSRENKITPWNNDWVRDPSGEALFIRDNRNGKTFTITPEPIRDEGEYIIRHSFGYSTFYHTANGIKAQQQMFCPKGEKLKLQIITLENISDKDKELSIYYYGQLVLGVYNYGSARYISTALGENYILGRNPYSKYFGNLKAYLTILGGEETTFTGDRKEFIGVEGELSKPLALKYEKLSNRIGSIYDPCLACESKIKIKSGEKREVVILLGEEENAEKIEEIIDKYKNIDECYKELENAKQYWAHFLGNIQVKTKDKSMDYLLNGWLLYQNYSCRYLSRTAFYQSGGAYGFRDQLQDSMSLGIVKPSITKEQIIRSASRQYLEGDVQHWWHPVINSGIRTRFSDDLLWLPYVTSEYIKRTGDYSILKEEATYLEDEPLKEGEDERYTIVNNSTKKGNIYEHCIRAIEKGLNFGAHNIPLMGSGDWNDGMSTVGNLGKGESVWLGWFLYNILDNFIDICSFTHDEEKKDRYKERKEFIKENLEKSAWDGGWYRRAYFDDGTPLGSRDNEECQIDSLAQSWSVISKAGNPNRSAEAMEAVDKNLVNLDKGMILLLAPPFEKSDLEPGYIKGYVAGVRENGGQYTHAAVWVILALTKLGLGDKACKYYNMINPINHSKTELEARTYKVEPYVISADVYIREPHGGRGGWSWYTGAAGWMYKVGLEDILGLKQIEGKGYKIQPCIPEDWDEYEFWIKNETEDYHIVVKRGKEEERNSEGIIIPRDKGKMEIEVII